MKKVLIISNSSGLVTDFLENDMKILKEKGYEIECACNLSYPGKNTDEIFKKYEVKTYNIDFPIRNLNIKMLVKSIFQLKKILKNNKYEMIHCHSTIAAAVGRFFSKKYRKSGTKVVYTSHGLPFYEGNFGKKAKIFYYIEKYLSKYTDGILCICEEDYNNLIKFKCNNVELIHGVGVDVDKFLNCDVNVNEKKRELEIQGKKIILSIGEINTNKNHQIIIKAISKLQNHGDYTYLICGREVTEIGKKAELENLAKKLNVNLKFLGFRNDIPEICKICDIGALPSYKEGLGLSGIELLAAGKPIVGSNRQGIKDYIKNGITGYLSDPDDDNMFSQNIEKCFELLKNKETKNNCKEMTEKFNKNQAYNGIKKVYDSLKI